jgi:serine/threonine protein kinase
MTSSTPNNNTTPNITTSSKNLPHLNNGLIRDHFYIECELGHGAFSKVYRALPISNESKNLIQGCKNGTTTINSTTVALKVVDLNAYEAGLPRLVANHILKLEMNILNRLHVQLNRHPHLVQIYGFLFEPSGDRVAIIMEELHGGDLFDHIGAKRFWCERDACQIIRQVAETLLDVHKLNILHRDLKPENIMFAIIRKTTTTPPPPKTTSNNNNNNHTIATEETTRLCLIDFGLGKIIGESDPYAEYTGSPIGTLGYMAPEINTMMSSSFGGRNNTNIGQQHTHQKVDKNSYTKASDVWSLGVILYILLSGRMPFSKGKNYLFDSNEDVEEKAMWGKISSSAKDLNSAMLTIDPNKRISLEQVLNHPWLNLFILRKEIVGHASGRTTSSTTNLTSSSTRPLHPYQQSSPLQSALDLLLLHHDDITMDINSNDDDDDCTNGIDFSNFLADYKARSLAHDIIVGAKFGLKLRLLKLLGGKDPKLSLPQLQTLLISFRRITNSDRITFVEFHRVISRLPVRKLPWDDIFRLFDRTGKGTISYVALLCHLASIRPLTTDVLKFCFQAHTTSSSYSSTTTTTSSGSSLLVLNSYQLAHLLRNLLSGRIDGYPNNNNNSNIVTDSFIQGNNIGNDTNYALSSLNELSMNPLASFCAVDEETADLEVHLFELFGSIDMEQNISFVMFMKIFVNEPIVYRYLSVVPVSPKMISSSSSLPSPPPPPPRVVVVGTSQQGLPRNNTSNNNNVLGDDVRDESDYHNNNNRKQLNFNHNNNEYRDDQSAADDDDDWEEQCTCGGKGSILSMFMLATSTTTTSTGSVRNNENEHDVNNKCIVM